MTDQLQDNLGEWVTALNHQLVQELRSGRFIGMTFMLADAAASTLQICAAGQFPPLRGDARRWESFPAQNHLPLGISSAVDYRASRAGLKPGESWMLFSDGVPEARNSAGEDFTLAKFQESLPLGETAAHTLAASVAAWQQFLGSAPQHDDASLLLLDWRGPMPPADFQTLCCPDTLCAGRAFIEQWAAFAGYNDVTAGQIVLACDEAATNIFRHAYQQASGPLDYHAELDDTSLTIRLTDRAKPCDPALFRPRELSELRPGGLGTFIISHVFDEVAYLPSAAGTSLTLRKALPKDS